MHIANLHLQQLIHESYATYLNISIPSLALTVFTIYSSEIFLSEKCQPIY